MKSNVFIIAEVSANHGQDFSQAVKMIKVAKKCGADAVKFQAYKPESLTIDCDNRHFQIKHPKWGGQTLYDLYKKAYTPLNWFKRLKKVADGEGILFFATAFDFETVDLLEDIGVLMHKLASFELVDLGLIEYMAKTKKPLMLSTGMANLSEIKEAVAVAKKSGAKDITLFKCVSTYPANPAQMNLRTIPDMKKIFNCSVGISDHTLGIASSVAAVALGATVIEKHFTLSRKIDTPDSFFSLEPQELKQLVDNAKIAQQSLGKVSYGQTKGEKKSKVFRRSLFVVEDIKKGSVFSEENIRVIRPSDGLAPKHLKEILGKKAKRNIKKGTPLNWGLIE